MMHLVKSSSIVRILSSLDIRQCLCRSLSSIPSSPWSPLTSTIKRLIDSRQYQQVIDLFHRQPQLSTDSIITMVLKASANLRDYRTGVHIHQQLTKKSLDNPYIQTSLIHFYSKCHVFLRKSIRLILSIFPCSAMRRCE
jgi:hypothetical protein